MIAFYENFLKKVLADDKSGEKPALVRIKIVALADEIFRQMPKRACDCFRRELV